MPKSYKDDKTSNKINIIGHVSMTTLNRILFKNNVGLKFFSCQFLCGFLYEDNGSEIHKHVD